MGKGNFCAEFALWGGSGRAAVELLARFGVLQPRHTDEDQRRPTQDRRRQRPRTPVFGSGAALGAGRTLSGSTTLACMRRVARGGSAHCAFIASVTFAPRMLQDALVV